MPLFKKGDRVVINETANNNGWYREHELKPGDFGIVLQDENHGTVAVKYDKLPGRAFNNTPDYHTLIDPRIYAICHRARLAWQRGDHDLF